MNKKNSKFMPLILGIGINLAIAVGIVFLYQKTFPKPEEVQAKTETVSPVNKDILSSDISTKIKERKSHGEIPVQVKPEELKKDNPFQ